MSKSTRYTLFFFLTLIVSIEAIGQKQVITDLNQALIKKDYKASKKLFSQEYWSAQESPNGEARVNTLMKDQYYFTITNSTQKDSLAIITCNYNVNGVLQKEPLYIYLELSKFGWTIDGINEYTHYHPQYLSGNVGGHFQPNTLPPSKELENYGNKLINDFHTNSNSEFSKYLAAQDISEEQLRQMQNLQLKQTYYSETLQRGVIMYEYQTPTGTQPLSLYVTTPEKKDLYWNIYDVSYYPPTLKLFFKEKK